MAYATNSDVQQRLGPALYVQLTDDAGSGAADEAIVTEAREYAESKINSMLARRFQVPIDVSSHAELAALLKSLTLDLTEHHLHARRPPVPETVVRKRSGALNWLEAAARGEAGMPSSDELPANPATGVSGWVQGSPRAMTRETLEDL